MNKIRHRKTLACDIMTKPVEIVRINDSIGDVARFFTERNIGAAAVEDQQWKLVGVITKTDIVRYEKEKIGFKVRDSASRVDRERDSHDVCDQDPNIGQGGFHVIEEEDTVERWMTPVIFTVTPETPLKEIARRMVKYGIHHIFVRGYRGEPAVGIVSSFDILKQIAKPLDGPDEVPL